MRLFNVGAGAPDERAQEATEHPSAPIPIVGPGVGETIRTQLGETGFEMFPMMLGAAEFGWNVDLETSHAILDRYVEFGGNAIHTADGFSGGRSEHIIGQWLRSRGQRDRSVLSVRIGAHADNPGLGSVNLVRAVEGSLTRLDVDRIDVLYLDATLDATTNLEDTLATVEWLREAGKIGAVGAFRLEPERLVEARILASAGYPRIEVIDAPYNLLRRQPFEGDLRLVAGAQNLAVTPSHALEHGFLSGRHRSKALTSQGVRGEQLRGHLNRRGIKILRALDQVAAELAVPVAAVSIAWLLAQRTVAAPIVNTFATDHVDELMQGAGVTLSRAHVAELTRAGN
ncbi:MULTISPECIES: aldo/keto reductase [unclassified Microbacterium]|uniref:aldo/keto reductase n=1 Tax=unclassified Microbacterium TaxID=2609290 RepID=UPI000EAA34C3|nr:MULTISPECIES: aldo/keto reductase [unclassified Microbacterium]MBT2485594.1 aldo/keto reductase [Microbacterium sp. ISL-108]RKN68375.1 aldo/keto reductase [Microbacterium sp. CGR2]